MKFHIAFLEAKNYRYGYLLDTACKYLCCGLEALGHDCTIGLNQLQSGRLNIIFGGHALRTPNDIDAIAAAGPYIVYQTERLGTDGIKYWQDKTQYEQVYLNFLRRAAAVWEGVPANVPILNSYGVPCRMLMGGYLPALEEIVHKRTKDIDFLFFGSITPHRRQMLQALQQRGYRTVTVFDARAVFRNDLIARAKVNLALRHDRTPGHLSWGRVCYLLNNRSLVCVERCIDQQWLEHCFPSADTEEWIALCEHTLMRPDRDAFAEEASERFRQIPFTEQLEKTLEGMSSSAAA